MERVKLLTLDSVGPVSIFFASVLALLLLARSGRGEDSPVGLPGAHEIRGVVKDRDGRGLTCVALEAMDGAGGLLGRADSQEGGRFVLHDLPLGQVTIGASLTGVGRTTREFDARKTVSVGSSDIVLVVDRGQELVLRWSGGSFARELGRNVATLVIDTATGPVTYFAAMDAGKAAFRRIRVGLPWTLWIPWNSATNGTLFEAGTQLQAGERVVTLQPGKRLFARLSEVDTRPVSDPRVPGSIRWNRIFATRGPIQEVGISLRAGRLEFPPVATGSWRITVRIFDNERGGNLETSAVVESGAPEIVLSPASVVDK